jgi:serine/threonine protein kinase
LALFLGQELFEYRIVRPLGQGAFGVVYLAHDKLLDRHVAIKELTVTHKTDEDAFKRFLREARAAGGLNHPNIVTIHALKILKASVFLVMEYLPGGSLRAMLKKRSRLSVEEAVRITADVGRHDANAGGFSAGDIGLHVSGTDTWGASRWAERRLPSWRTTV